MDPSVGPARAADRDPRRLLRLRGASPDCAGAGGGGPRARERALEFALDRAAVLRSRRASAAIAALHLPPVEPGAVEADLRAVPVCGADLRAVPATRSASGRLGADADV